MLDRVFHLALVDVIGATGCYILVALFYLLAFYCAMLKTSVVLGEGDPLKNLRDSVPWLKTLVRRLILNAVHVSPARVRALSLIVSCSRRMP